MTEQLYQMLIVYKNKTFYDHIYTDEEEVKRQVKQCRSHQWHKNPQHYYMTYNLINGRYVKDDLLRCEDGKPELKI